MTNTADFCALLANPKFFELRHRREPIMGELKPKGQPMEREIIGYNDYYDLAWSVSDYQVRWVRAKTLEELPRLVAASAWR